MTSFVTEWPNKPDQPDPNSRPWGPTRNWPQIGFHRVYYSLLDYQELPFSDPTHLFDDVILEWSLTRTDWTGKTNAKLNKKFTYGPVDNIPLIALVLNIRKSEVIRYSIKPLKTAIAMRCEANLRLPNRLSNILE